MLSRILLTWCAAVALATSAGAQAFRPREGRQPATDPFAAEGTVHGVMPGQIQMMTATNQPWIVFLDPMSKVHVRGTAEPDFLKRGMFIRFSAQLDKRGKSQSPIAELTVFTPSAETPVGIWPAGAAPVMGAEGANQFGATFGPGVNAGPGAAKAPATSFYTVGGQITGERKGKLTVNAGRGIVQIELTESPVINVDFADYTVVRKGDKISVRGRMFRGRQGFAQAQELTIEVAQPLTDPRRKPTKPKAIPPRPPQQPEKPAPPPEKKPPKSDPLKFNPDG